MRIGVAGVGVVGQGVIKYLSEHPDFAPAIGEVVVTAVSARDRYRKRDVDLTSYQWFDDPVALATSDAIDLFVELIGGSEGPAKAAVEAATPASARRAVRSFKTTSNFSDFDTTHRRCRHGTAYRCAH